MLTKVEARNPQGSLMSFQLDDDSSGYLVRDVQGLDPVNATLAKSDFAQQDGTQFNAARREDRNVVILLDLKPDDAATEVNTLRKQLYAFFMPKSPVDLRFYDGDLVVNASGRVESCVAPLFTDKPKATIAITCFDPDFIALDPVEISGSTVSDTTETLIPYEGTTDTGFELVLSLNRAETDFSIFIRSADGTTRQMDFVINMVSGDTLTVNTQTGQKEVSLVHSAVQSDALFALQGSTWLTLSQGDSYIRVYASGSAIPYTLTYTPRYGGL